MILEGGEVRVDLRPTSSLLPHEETIPEQLEKLASQIKREGVQRDPLIVDRASGTVLDGMHRLAAFSKLRLENVVCALVDYSSPSISLRRWARIYTTTRSALMAQAIEELGLTQNATLTQAFDALDSKGSAVAMISQRGCRVPAVRMELEEAFRLVRALDEVSRTLGWRRTFVREEEVDFALQEASNYVLMVGKLTKQDVLDAAMAKKLFPCKTSMHIIDPRPVALEFPIAGLNEATPKSLTEFLSKRTPKMLPRGSVYEGRRYKERLLLLDQV